MKNTIDNIIHFLKNIWIYRDILWYDCHWDYSNSLRFEKRKLELQIYQFEHSHTKDHKQDLKWMKVCVKLLNIILSTNQTCVHVNRKNEHRFYAKGFLNEMLYYEKVFYLYNKIRANYMFDWWD